MQLQCLSCGEPVDVAPYTSRGGAERVGGRCSCGLTMNAVPGVWREATGYWVSRELRLRVEYTVGRFGPARASIQIGDWRNGTPIAPLRDIILRIPDIVRGWGGSGCNAAEPERAPSAREAKREHDAWRR